MVIAKLGLDVDLHSKKHVYTHQSGAVAHYCY